MKRLLIESMIFGYSYGDGGGEPLSEDAPFGPAPEERLNPGDAGLHDMETMVLEATGRDEIEGIVLRVGLFYGPEVGSTRFHDVDATQTAVVPARRRPRQALLDPGPKSIPVTIAKIGSSCYAALMAQTNLRASNAPIKQELG